jgi:hypothetical protein
MKNYLIFWFSILALSSCGPTIIKNKPIEAIGIIAILPTTADSDIRRERVKYLDDALMREFEGSGYSVLNSDVIQDLCSNDECPEKNLLTSRYGVGTFAQLKINSASRSNFIAGYYNRISGLLKLTDDKAAPIMSIENSASERGGLIFDSGQIIQGIRGTVENYGDEKFSALADRFIREVVGKLPKPDSKIDAESFFINNVKLSMHQGSLYDICLDGSPNSKAKLIIGARQIVLREVQPGKYCNTVPLGWMIRSKQDAVAELRSAVGQSLTTSLDTVSIGVCDPKQVLDLQNNELKLTCTGAQCAEDNKSCQQSKFIAFSSSAKEGPFIKVSEFSLTKPRNKFGSKYTAIVSIANDGTSSLPVLFGAN